MFTIKRTTDRAGVVLIVVIGVLAVLSLLAATFSMLMRVELSASRYNTEHEMARQAAHDGAQFLIASLKQQLAAGITSGVLPDLCPNPGDSLGCSELYRRGNYKVYYLIDPHPRTAAASPWTVGLGLEDAGMFNINCMGFAADLGNNTDPSIRRTSFDMSLVRLLKLRFDTMSAADQDLVEDYYDDFNIVGGVGDIARQRVAILVNKAILAWRHGNNKVPGMPGTEEHRLGHLPRWSATIGCAGVNAGTGWPGNSDTSKEWGHNDGLPSSVLLRTDGIGDRWSWFEVNSMYAPAALATARMWASKGDPATEGWRDDIGIPTSAQFWGRIESVAPSGGNFIIVLDDTRLGWRDFIAAQWNGAFVGVNGVNTATGEVSNWYGTVSATTATKTLTVSGAGIGAPKAGHSICLSLVGVAPWLGTLNGRWAAAAAGTGDMTPTAMFWPDGSLVAETGILDLVYGDAAKCIGGGPTVTAVNGTPSTLIDSARAAAGGTPWAAGDFPVPVVVRITDGPGTGQVRRIIGYTPPDTLNILGDWTVLPTGSYYQIERYDDSRPSKYHPDALQGDDRAYLSLGELREVLALAIQADNDGSATLDQARACADLLLACVQKHLTVSSRAGQALQEAVSINDWRTDGLDNDANGVVDDEAQPATAALALALYDRLGLKLWANADPTRVPQAAQLVANIIDFRDADHIPTRLTHTDLGETTAFTVYGAEGVHVTEVMPSPDAVYSTTGAEMIDDGGPGPQPALADLKAWDWNVAGYWEVLTKADGTLDAAAANPNATFTFTAPAGFYAIRLIGKGLDTLGAGTVTCNTTACTVGTATTDPEDAAWQTAFLKSATGLFCVDTAGGVTLTIRAPLNTQFKGFALCNQYIEITNIAARDIDAAGWKVTTNRGEITIPSTNPAKCIRGASADGIFPINYGTYVIAICEEAYEKTWGVDKGGIWGDVAGEDYTVWAAGDVLDDNAFALLLGAFDGTTRAPSVRINDAAGNLIAGGAVDGAIPPVADPAVSLDAYSSIEKTRLLQPTWDTATAFWATHTTGAPALAGSQNISSTIQGDPPRKPASDTGWRTNLNKGFAALWSAYPTLNKGSAFAAADQVFPIILNQPYPTVGWLGLVSTSNAALRTVDANPDPNTAPTEPEHLLGTLMAKAATGGVYARLNINTATAEALGSVFSGEYAGPPVPPSTLPVFDGEAGLIVSTRNARDKGSATPAGPNALADLSWANWDELLIDPIFQNAVSSASSNYRRAPDGLGFFDKISDNVSNDDSGAGTYADDFMDDSDEKEEWARRFGNLFDLRSTAFKFTVAGLVYKNEPSPGKPLAEVRIEMDVDLATDTDFDGIPDVRVEHFRYLFTQ